MGLLAARMALEYIIPFFYCFGCHARGDAISFVRETENVSFMEAAEILAREAGMAMPARDPKAQEKHDRRSQLADVIEQAVKFYRFQLKTGAGRDARGYLARRGLDRQALDRWEFGFSENDGSDRVGRIVVNCIPIRQEIAKT